MRGSKWYRTLTFFIHPKEVFGRNTFWNAAYQHGPQAVNDFFPKHFLSAKDLFLNSNNLNI